jgi:hypothetical protein
MRNHREAKPHLGLRQPAAAFVHAACCGTPMEAQIHEELARAYVVNHRTTHSLLACSCAAAGCEHQTAAGCRSPGWLRHAWVLGLLFVLQTLGNACTVPVFRYGLDNWAPEPWQLEAPLSAFTTEPLGTDLRNLGATSPLNLTASPLDSGDVAKLYFPVQTSPEKTIAWQGKLDAAAWAQLTTSQARQELAKRILAGESAVWVIVQGSDAAEHEALASRLTKRVTFLESAAQLPVIDPNDPDSKLGPGPEVMLKFSSLKINRADPQETVLAAMLAGTKGLAEIPAAQSFAALVFGRGRVLGAWPAAELTESFIDDTTLFVIKACSCQAKAQNPGWDLLMNVNWDESLRAIEDARPTPRPKATAAAPEMVTISPTPSGAAVMSHTADHRWLFGGMAALAFAVIATFFLLRRKV